MLRRGVSLSLRSFSANARYELPPFLGENVRHYSPGSQDMDENDQNVVDEANLTDGIEDSGDNDQDRSIDSGGNERDIVNDEEKNEMQENGMNSTEDQNENNNIKEENHIEVVQDENVRHYPPGSLDMDENEQKVVDEANLTDGIEDSGDNDNEMQENRMNSTGDQNENNNIKEENHNNKSESSTENQPETNSPPNDYSENPTPESNSYLVNKKEDLIIYNEDELQQIYHEGVIKFNLKPKSIRQFLISKKVICGDPSEIAEFIIKNPKLSKRRIGEYIGNYEDFHQKVCDELFSRYDFKNKALDTALRLLLLQFRLPGEAQQIDRILEKFATHYHLQNPGVFLSSDTAYVLSFSLIMLNTDLHNQSITPEKKMTIDQFIKNNRGINQGQDISKELLVSLYNSVKENEIRMEETDMYESEVIAFMAPTKSGWLSKKTENLLDFGMWRRFWFVLNDGCLYYFTDPSDEGPLCIIPLDNTKPHKGKNELEVILTSSVSGDHIKSSKVLEDGRMEQGRHTQLVFRCENIEERDSWVKVLQEESLRFKPLHEIFLRRREELAPIEVTPIVVPQAPLAEGWMREKWIIPRVSWKRRYMVLYSDFDGEGDTIFYYVSQQLAVRMKEFGTQTQQGFIRMKDLKSMELVSSPNSFTYIQLTTDDNRKLQLIPDDPEQLDHWYDTLYASLSSLSDSKTKGSSPNIAHPPSSKLSN